MTISKQSVHELEAILSRHEKEHGTIDLKGLVTSNCDCTGSHCSNSCSGNKGNLW